MATLTAALIAYLVADSQLRGFLPGGIYDRPLLKAHGTLTEGRDRDRAATPEAWDRRTGALLPSAVVRIGGVGISLAGQALVSGLTGVTLGARRTVSIWLYQQYPETDVLELTKVRVIEVLHQAQVATDHEGAVVLRWVGDLGTAVYDDDLDAYLDEVRFSAGTMLGRKSA